MLGGTTGAKWRIEIKIRREEGSPGYRNVNEETTRRVLLGLVGARQKREGAVAHLASPGLTLLFFSLLERCESVRERIRVITKGPIGRGYESVQTQYRLFNRPSFSLALLFARRNSNSSLGSYTSIQTTTRHHPFNNVVCF